MSAPLGLDGVLARIGAIESAFGGNEPSRAAQSSRGAASTESAANGSVIAGVSAFEPFDPFGAQYQAAVEASGGMRTNRALDQAMERAYATPISGATPIGGATSSGTPFGVGGTGSVGAVGSTGSSREVAAPGVRPVGGYGSMPVPTELQGYGNGRIPPDRLTRISQGNHRLYAPAAQAWDQLVATARQSGFELRITDSYRSYGEQVDLAERKGLYSQGGLAARPGTSNHGWGLAVDADVRDPALLEWMRINAPRFGWLETVPREPWHWEFRPHQA